MQCPRLHGNMESIQLNASIGKEQRAYLCTACHGVWLPEAEVRSYLGFDSITLTEHSRTALIPFSCPQCQGACRTTAVRSDFCDEIRFFFCPVCGGCFFDGTQFAIIFNEQTRSARTTSGILSQSPIDRLGVTCCDCGTEVANLDELCDVGIGYCCRKCRSNPPILSENKIQNVQLITFHNMEIKIDHWQSSTQSRIAVTPVEPCLLNVRLYSLSIRNRIERFGFRRLRLHSPLGRIIDATEGIEHRTPWHVFLKQRGVSWCLNEAVSLGKINFTFKPHSLVFEIDAKRMGIETKQRFEALIRRLLIVYERFAELTKSYTIPEISAELTDNIH